MTMVWALLGELVQPAWGRQGWLGLFEIPEWSLNQSLNGHRAAFDGRKDRDVGSVGISRVT